jgi:hypothetical protein
MPKPKAATDKERRWQQPNSHKNGDEHQKEVQKTDHIDRKDRPPQAHFGRLLGIERQQLNHYFSGRKEPSASRVLQIQDQLKRKPAKETKPKRKPKP